MASFCSECGAGLPPGAKFCPECGTGVAGGGEGGKKPGAGRKPGGKHGRAETTEVAHRRGGGGRRAEKRHRAAAVEAAGWLGPYRTPVLVAVAGVVVILLYIGTQGRSGEVPIGGPGGTGVDLSAEIIVAQRRLVGEPDNMDLVAHLAHLYFDSGQFESAVTYYRRLLQADPAVAEHRTDMGAALDALGRYEEAKQAFLEVLEYRPGFDKAMFNLGVVHEHLNDVPGARVWYGRLIQENPMSPMVADARQRLRALEGGG